MIFPAIFLALAFLLYIWMTKRYGHLDFPQISRSSLLISIALALPLFYIGSCTWNNALDNPAMQDTLWLTGLDIFFTGFPLTSFVLDFAWSNWDQWWGVASLAGAFILQWLIWGQIFAVAVYWTVHGREISNFIKKKFSENRFVGLFIDPDKYEELGHRERQKISLFFLVVILAIIGMFIGIIVWLEN